jgi:uncharacterized protein (DUF2252 family)
MTSLPISPTDLPRTARILTAINEQNEKLLDADRRAKYEKMAGSAFAFYRGTNHLFWEDFAGDRRISFFGDELTRTWLQGDLHIENFGAFGNDEGTVVYNINDFDEAVIADYQYDLWRLAVSIVLVARQNEDLTAEEQKNVVRAFAESYLGKLESYIGHNDEYELVFDSSNTSGKLDNFLKAQEKKSSRAKMLNKWTRVEDNGRVFNFDVTNDEGDLLLEATTDSERDSMLCAIEAYDMELVKKPRGYHSNYFEIKDVARRLLAGTGSLGTPRYYVLIEGENSSLEDDRILDIKRQSMPTAYRYLQNDAQSEYEAFKKRYEGGDAKWHEAAYRALAVRTDDHLGWLILEGEDYSVRERSFFKKAFPVDELDSESRFSKLAKQWGAILAFDHSWALRSFDSEYPGVRQEPSHSSLNERVKELTQNSLKTFEALVCEVAFTYADQVAADRQYFTKALNQM